MNEIFFMAELTAGVFAAFFLLVKRDTFKSVISGLLLVKVNIIWMIASGSFAAAGFFLAAYAGSLVCLGLMTAALSPGPSGSKPALREYFGFITALILLILFASGCSRAGNEQNPQPVSELNLGFVPSKIAAEGKDSLYVAMERGRTITLFNMLDKTKITSIAAGYMPVDILLAGRKLYSANKSGDTVTIHDIETGKSVNIYSGGSGPSALALNPVKNILYAANMGSNNVAVIDLNSTTVEVRKKISTGKWPSDLYLSPDNRYLYVCCKYTNTVQIIDAERELPVFTKVDTGISPLQLVPISKNEIAIINEWEYAFNRQSSIIIFNRTNYKAEYDIMTDGGIFEAVLSRSRKYLYITVPLSDRVIFVDIRKREKVFELSFKDGLPRWLALSKDGKTLYVALQQSRKIISIAVNGLI